jgi:hypothetical protein
MFGYRVMSSTRKVAIGLGIAGGALLAAWLLTGSRKKKTRNFLVRTASDIKKSLAKNTTSLDDSDVHYV